MEKDSDVKKKKALPKIPIVYSKSILYPSPPGSPKNPDSDSTHTESDITSSSEKEVITHRPSNISYASDAPDLVFPPILPSVYKPNRPSQPLPSVPSVHSLPSLASSPFSKKKHHTYLVISEIYKDAERLCFAIQGEYHMHVKTSQFLSVVISDEVAIVVCTPKSIFNHCKVMNSLIRSQNGKAVCVCVLPELNRRAIVDEKQKMMSMMNENNIVFVAYDKKDHTEITTLEKFWREVDSITGQKQ